MQHERGSYQETDACVSQIHLMSLCARETYMENIIMTFIRQGFINFLVCLFVFIENEVTLSPMILLRKVLP